MAVTSIEAPTSNTTLGTSLGDGNNYVSWTYPERMYSSGTNVCVASGSTAGNRGNLWSNCFTANIPVDAVITGVELVADVNARFGNAGSTGSTESLTYRMYLYNGIDYAPVEFLSTPFGGSLSSDGYELTLTGANRYYRNNSTGLDILAGSSTSLSGLTWSPYYQNNFGFVILTNAKVDTPVGVLSGQGDMGLRVTYSVSSNYPNIVTGVAPNDIDEVTTVETTSILRRSFPNNSIAPIDIIYQFEGETTQTNPSLNWSPSNGWVNGSSATNGTYWGRSSNKFVKGWNCDLGSTPSSTTGPLGGVVIPQGTQNAATKYIYTEVSSNSNAFCFVARTPLIPKMNNINNDLTLKFWVHAYGSAMGDLYVYIDDAATSNHNNATQLAAYESWSGFTSSSSNYQEKTISLNNYRSNTTDYYIYFVSQNATSWQGDLTIDGVQIIEE